MIQYTCAYITELNYDNTFNTEISCFILFHFLDADETKFKIQLLDSHGARTPRSHTSSGYCGGQFRYRTQKVLLDAISLGYLQDACCFALDCWYGNDSQCLLSFTLCFQRPAETGTEIGKEQREKGGREGREEGEREERMEGWKRGDQLSSGPRK